MATSLTIRKPTTSSLPVMESNVLQSIDEVREYALDLTDFASPSSPVVTVRNMTTDNDATASVLSVAGAIVSTDLTFTIANLKRINRYKIDMRFTTGSETIEPYLVIDCEQ